MWFVLYSATVDNIGCLISVDILLLSAQTLRLLLRKIADEVYWRLPMDHEKFYTAAEISKILKVSKQYIYNISNSKLPITNRLPYKRIGRLKRFKIEDVLEYFENRSME